MQPPYRVPSMPEIAAVKPNGLGVISTFAGAGGSSLGYRMAGFKVLWASEFVEAARVVYAANAAPGTIVDGRDIRQVDPLEVLQTLKLKPGELDVLDGSPPCASFSTAGKRDKHWGKTKRYSDVEQRTDDLFFEYVRFLEAMQPRAFVAENVSGLVKGVAKGYFIRILEAMKGCGYRVEARLLDAQWLGVPQARQRIIFIGVRNDLDQAPIFPEPMPHRYSVRDAIPWIDARPRIVGDYASKSVRGKEVSADAPLPTVFAGVHGGGPHQFYIEGDAPSIEGLAIGREYDKLNLGQESDKFFNLKRAPLAGPCQTVTAQGGGRTIASVTHPTEKRKFSIAELKRICAFPDDFVLSGTYAQQWERLGRAVPPLMMRAIALKVTDALRQVSSRTPARAPRSPGRSTTGQPPKGAGRRRTGRPNAERTLAPVR
jgi:DNA (cytosine-5)-methyltransferase 1